MIDEAARRMKEMYNELDEITVQLKELGFRTEHVGERIITLVDNFATKNVAFRSHGIRRYELKFDDTPMSNVIDFDMLPPALKSKYKGR